MIRLKVAALVAFGLIGVASLYVVSQGVDALRALTPIEQERDGWQRPSDVIGALSLEPGNVVVDLGSGVGYFALKISPIVGERGAVVAVDLRRESLAFLWIRAWRAGARNIRVIVGDADDPRVPSVASDAVLVANTYHELANPRTILGALSRSMKRGARIVVVDRGPRTGAGSREAAADHHEIAPDLAEQAVRQAGFEVMSRQDRFIDRPADDHVWWLLVARKP